MTKSDHDKHFVGQITQKALIVHDDKVLLVQYPESDVLAAGMWDMPGGRLNEGEDPVESLKREVKEEIGAEIAIEGILQTGVFVSLSNRPTFFVVYKARLVNPEQELQEEQEEVGAIQWIEKSWFEKLRIIYPQYNSAIRSAFV